MVDKVDIPITRAGLYEALESGELAPAKAVELCRGEESLAGVRARPLVSHLPKAFSRAARDLCISCGLGGQEPVSSLTDEQAAVLVKAMESYESDRIRRTMARRHSAAMATNASRRGKTEAMRHVLDAFFIGEVSFPDAVAQLREDKLGSQVPFSRFLQQFPKIGKVKASKIMAETGISEGTVTGNITDDQARAVQLALTRIGVLR